MNTLSTSRKYLSNACLRLNIVPTKVGLKLIKNSPIRLLGKVLCGLGLLSSLAHAEDRTLRVYNWFDYITPKALEDFKAQNTQTKLVYDVYDTNETLEAKLLTGNSGYDVVNPGDMFFAKEIAAGVFQPLDRSKLPNWKHLDPNLMKLVEDNDPGNKFGVPYMYGTVLIGFNPAKVKAALGDNAPVDSWDLIFKEENISKLKQCGVALLDSPSEILPLALRHLGLDPNSANPADYTKAEELLMKIRPFITYFHSSKYMADIANGDICVAVGYSGSFFQANNRAKDAKNGVVVDMRLPKEGAPVWFDMLSIPKSAKNPEDAYAFINYLLEPKVIAPISDFVGYPNPNKDATELVDPAIRNNPNLYPTEATMKTLYSVKPLPREAERARTRAWTRIKSGV
ncbi:spermidine/putrescine ABC transporter substrate-binding protein PotF [Pseudomonas sp. FW305-25]|uniref:Polyamine ABC transporter substrate-binding protein n=1 Tax=Pseudomonas chlororaphis TaxID=587753 RepID=A0AB34C3H9_9PSED|nr:polyamine ABC transporter substrate-binding protein [Pseudomonas chlororaphis]PMY68975.1 spermidine/putrescine ABC transporter substrate-binding protein PotF [Pseudomonas sp. FW305-25]PMY73041.1 spermidine/putrescine ABC transporter substrate-binding protein PotF [Pseudomonas sp. FW126-L8]PNA82935.1 spermidine/putrescine ABC transporter substrate-binding protein PotF [Pseudomonas sp. FW305-76]